MGGPASGHHGAVASPRPPARIAPNPIVERYDRDADRYGHHWAPVLDASARGLLARVAAEVRLPAAPVILDVGTGHGVLAFEALARWPAATVIATDASAGMLAQAREPERPRSGWPGDPRLRFQHAPAAALGVGDASVDLVVSSFVYQLVPDRATAFAEVAAGAPAGRARWRS